MADDIKLPPLPRPQVPFIESDVDLFDIKVLVQWCERTATAYARAAVLADRHERNCGALERVAALLHEEATGEPWTVAGVEHPGPDRDHYRKLARKVLALAAPAYGGEDD